MPVYDGETVGEFCARVVGVPSVDSSVELLWGTILLPETEALQQLVITKPWQIDFRSGKEKLLLRLPPGVQPSREMEKYMKIKEVVEPRELDRAPHDPTRGAWLQGALLAGLQPIPSCASSLGTDRAGVSVSA